MKRGFKASAERMSLAEREVLGLTSSCRLDPKHLALSKGYEVIDLSSLPSVPAVARQRLLRDDPDAFSAAAVVRDQRALIVVNDAQPVARQANSVAHELAHLLLGHEPGEAFSPYGSRSISKETEDEADWLAGCLLVPGSGIPVVLERCDGELEAAAKHFGISLQLMRWRFNKTQPRRRPRAQ